MDPVNRVRARVVPPTSHKQDFPLDAILTKTQQAAPDFTICTNPASVIRWGPGCYTQIASNRITSSQTQSMDFK